MCPSQACQNSIDNNRFHTTRTILLLVVYKCTGHEDYSSDGMHDESNGCSTKTERLRCCNLRQSRGQSADTVPLTWQWRRQIRGFGFPILLNRYRDRQSQDDVDWWILRRHYESELRRSTQGRNMMRIDRLSTKLFELFCDDTSHHLLPAHRKQTRIHLHSCLCVFFPRCIDKSPSVFLCKVDHMPTPLQSNSSKVNDNEKRKWVI